MQSLGMQLLASLTNDPKGLELYVHNHLHTEQFRGEEVKVFEYYQQHVENHGVLPSFETIEASLGEELVAPPEPPSYYVEQVQNRYIQNQLKQVMVASNELLKQKKPIEALQTLTEWVSKLAVEQHHTELVDFSESAVEYLQQEYNLKKGLGDAYGIQLGWETLDAMVGGLVGGDVLSIIGRPASGKSYQLLYMAHHAWMQGKVPLIVSMEMKPLPLMQRLAAIHTHTPIDQIKHAHLPTMPSNEEGLFFDALSALQGDATHPFWIVDGNLASTAQDIAMLARQLKPDVLLVDGAYLVRPTERLHSAWEKIKSTLEDLKQNACTALNIPLIASYQFNREATKVKNQGEIGLEHIAGGDVIGQISSVVLGLLEPDSVETLVSKEIKILKGRSGEVGRFKINWKFNQFPYMSFTEILPDGDDEEKDLEFMF